MSLNNYCDPNTIIKPSKPDRQVIFEANKPSFTGMSLRRISQRGGGWQLTLSSKSYVNVQHRYFFTPQADIDEKKHET